ncbi:hypothetical protein N7466_006003 [Penicillium verhagenii]|uniref:uncharacterized protein n=1 Tax=Penicillium verhagenii TaxID=1562060 RepID=UPI002544F4BE|nr:uncharacterized protein N7466_006003 [Penicillium verhagenii]KAJ5930510.1 hypothetical protein N7466_006003 [Penicillium verhagenii]
MEENVNDIPVRAEDALRTKRKYLSPFSRSGTYTASNYKVNTDRLPILSRFAVNVDELATRVQPARQLMDMANLPFVTCEQSKETGLFEIKKSPFNVPRRVPKSVIWESPRVKGKWRMEREKGPATHFPTHLLDILEHWHENNGVEPPPCFWKGQIEGTKKWGNFKVFDREGEEHEISIIRVSCTAPRYRTYCIILLHSEDEADVFIDYSDTRTIKANDQVRYDCQFLTAWHGARHGFERLDCAIHVWAEPGRKIHFCPSWFDRRDSVAQGFRTRARGRSPYPAVPMTPTPGDQHGGYYTFNSIGSKISASSSKKPVPDADSDEEGIVAPTLPLNRSLFSPTSIRFKLFSEASPHERVFCFNNPISSDAIFKKAREFLPEAEMSRGMGLLCKVPGQAQIRYIGEGCADEFDILCEDIRRMSLRNSGVSTIEVKPYRMAYGV